MPAPCSPPALRSTIKAPSDSASPKLATRLRLRARASLLVGLVGCACTASAPPQQPSAGPPAAPEPQPVNLAQATVYSADGKASACGEPAASCPEIASDRDFLDRCKLAGFQVRRCGCQDRCSGNVYREKKYYDKNGQQKDCAPRDETCTLPETSAAFQDACEERRHKLVVCGCDWLCDGPIN